MSGDPPSTRASLLVRIRDSSDHSAWQQFVQLYEPLLRSYLRRHGLQDADAADVAQDTLQRVAGAIGRLEYDRAKGRFRGWLLKIARQRLIDHVSRARRGGIGSGDSAINEMLNAKLDDEDTRQWDHEYEQRIANFAMNAIRSEFQEGTWQAFYQTAIENRPADQVAEELGMSVGAVYSAKSRVTARLRRAVAEMEEDT